MAVWKGADDERGDHGGVTCSSSSATWTKKGKEMRRYSYKRSNERGKILVVSNSSQMAHNLQLRSHFGILRVAVLSQHSSVPPCSGRVHLEVAVVQAAGPADGRHIPGAGAHDRHAVDLQTTCTGASSLNCFSLMASRHQGWCGTLLACTHHLIYTHCRAAAMKITSALNVQ